MSNTVSKPGKPWPPLASRVLRKVLPHSVYRRYVGRHEDESIRIWVELSKNVGSHNAILDIGAFEGEFALASRKVNPLAQIYAFEPNPSSASNLRARCLEAQIELVEAAVADSCGSISFSCDQAQSHLVANSDPAVRSKVVTVKSVTLDVWTQECDVRPTLMKIDVEGAEAAILRKAQRVLASYSPTIICEVLDDEAGKEVMAALPSNYRYFYINENGGVIRQDRIWRRRWRDKNWLLKPAQ